ncbi:hypothetical protein D9M68_700690 [compost metagenome]
MGDSNVMPSASNRLLNDLIAEPSNSNIHIPWPSYIAVCKLSAIRCRSSSSNSFTTIRSINIYHNPSLGMIISLSSCSSNSSIRKTSCCPSVLCRILVNPFCIKTLSSAATVRSSACTKGTMICTFVFMGNALIKSRISLTSSFFTSSPDTGEKVRPMRA